MIGDQHHTVRKFALESPIGSPFQLMSNTLVAGNTNNSWRPPLRYCCDKNTKALLGFRNVGIIKWFVKKIERQSENL